MITINFCNMTFTCEKAIKGSDYVHLVDADGNLIACFEGVTDFGQFTISGGSWTMAPSNDSCEIAVVGADGVIRKSTKKAANITALQTKVSNLESTIAALPERWNLLWEGAASEGTTISIPDADKYNVFAITYDPGSGNYHTVLAVRGGASEALIEGSGSWASTWTDSAKTYLGVALFSCTFSVESASRWTLQQSRLISLDMRDKVGDKTESELFSSGKKNIKAIYGVA